MNYDFLTKTSMFHGCGQEEISDLLSGLKHSIREYKKGSIIYHSGVIVPDLGMVLEGSVQIESVDLFGVKSILGISEKGDVFAESYACIPDQPLLVDVAAREDTTVLFINIPALLSANTGQGCTSLLIRNLLGIASRKNLRLSMRIFHSSPKKIRARLYSYFSEQVTVQGSTHIRIPLDRQQLADYLGVERTALSKELGKMKKEGLLDYHKNDFKIYTDADGSMK